jgi:D-threo-aldose 1-dehydrogenase
MQTVALAGTDLTPSRLAFGSASLMGRLGRRESLRLLEAAHDTGITHFDTARSYGYGDAESALGDFLVRHRDGVTVTTKLGISPPRRSSALRAAKTAARLASSRLPWARRVLGERARSLARTGRFHPADARSSLETSLRELRTDAVDILLLHECRPADLQWYGLLEFLEDAVREGKVRYFGLGTDPESTRRIIGERPEYTRVVQVAHSALSPTLERLRGLADRGVITHSAVGPPLAKLTELLADAGRRDRWSRALGLDCGRPATLARLLLAYALRSNSKGVVLFSSTSKERVRSNAALARGDGFSSDQIRLFARLAREAATGEDR